MKKLLIKQKAIAIAFFMVSLFLINKSNAQITNPLAWTQQYASTTYPAGAINASYAIANGSNRLLVVAVATTQTAVGAISCSVTYGGVSLTLASGDGTVTTDWNHTFLFYLTDANIGSAAGGKSLNVTCSGGTSYYTYVGAAVFAGVNQSTPYTTAVNFNSGGTASSAVGPLSGFNINAGDQAISVINLARGTTGTTLRTITTFATNWSTPSLTSSGITTGGPDFQAYVIPRSVTTAATGETAQHTASSTNTFSSYTAMSIQAAPTITSLGSSSGCVGSSLIINGTNLSGATSVTIGGTAATITGNTSTTVTVTVGSGTTGIVSVVTPNGTATSASTFTVNPLPTITLGTNPSVCSGITSANLTYSATTGSPTTYSITWNAAALSAGFTNVTNTALNASPVVLTVPGAAASGTYNGTLTVTNSGGCTSTGSSISVTINSLPSASATKNDVQCFNTSTGQIIVAGSGGSGTFSFYSINNGFSYQASSTFNNLPAGTYQIRVKDSNGCASKLVQ